MWVRTQPAARKWLVQFEGGGHCTNSSDCYARTVTSEFGKPVGYFGSSTSLDVNDTSWAVGILSTNAFANPEFAAYNVAYVHNCDGGFFLGNADEPVLVRPALFEHRLVDT